MARATFFTRSSESFQPNIFSTTRMSPNRLVMARACGLPLTLLNSIGRLPSKMLLQAGDLEIRIDLLVGLDQQAFANAASRSSSAGW